jgi:LPS-assembly lipoprotein
MSSPNRLLVLAAALALAGCTAGPLYGTTSVDPATGARSSVLTELRGRIALTPAQTRTAQVFRNAMLYKLNGATPVSAPLYELRYTVSATDQIAAVEAGTGTPSAALYRMTVDYELIRTADLKSLARGQRFATVPYDRTSQLFAASRAVVDARDQAGETVAERVLGAVAPVLQREAFTDPAPVVSKN